MQVIFARNIDWVSITIQILTRGEWSHVGIVDGDSVIESVGPPTWDYITHIVVGKDISAHSGVLVTPLKDFYKRYSHTELRFLPGDINKARERVGRPFDMNAIFGHLFNQNWQDPDKDCCTELTVSTMPIDPRFAHKFTPAILYWMSSPKERWQ
jgi:hypothetical protein